MSKTKYKKSGIIYKILNFRISVLLSNLIFQGIRYMSSGEKIYKISLTLIFGSIFYLPTRNIFISILFGHILNYILNGQFYVVFRYLSSKSTMSLDDLTNYVVLINKLIKIFSPKDVLIIGSFARGSMSKTSDLDIRLYHDGTFLNSLKAYFMATLLRLFGLFMRFPIDIFCFSDLRFLEKISKKEIPVNFLKNNNILKKYPTSKNYNEHIKTLIIC
jgi:predicted nucleotidyltransferase